MARSRYSLETWTQIRADYAAGMTYAKLSEKYNIPMTTVKAAGGREGWGAQHVKRKREQIVANATKKTIELQSQKIVKLNQEMLAVGESLFGIAKAKLNVFIRKVNENAVDEIDTAQYKKIVDAYHILILDIRLQTGQSTENVDNRLFHDMVRIDLTKEETRRIEAEVEAIFKVDK